MSSEHIKKLMLKLEEMTSSGAVASVAMPMGKTQKRIEEVDSPSNFGKWANKELAGNTEHDIESLQKHFGHDVAYDAASHGPAMMQRKDKKGNLKHLVRQPNGNYKSYDAKEQDLAEEVDTGQYDARKFTPSSKEKDDVFRKHRERLRDLDKSEPSKSEKENIKETELNVGIEAHGVRGMKNKPWRKTFKSQEAFERWLDANQDDVEVHGTREVNTNDMFKTRKMSEGSEDSSEEKKFKFKKTHCSQCGQTFGPGNSGYSSCKEHSSKKSKKSSSSRESQDMAEGSVKPKYTLPERLNLSESTVTVDKSETDKLASEFLKQIQDIDEVDNLSGYSKLHAQPIVDPKTGRQQQGGKLFFENPNGSITFRVPYTSDQVKEQLNQLFKQILWPNKQNGWYITQPALSDRGTVRLKVKGQLVDIPVKSYDFSMYKPLSTTTQKQGVEEGFSTDPTGPATWNGHKVVANRKTPKGSFLILQNKNDGKYEIHKQNPGVVGGLEFMSVHKTPEEMQTAFKQLTGIDESKQDVAKVWEPKVVFSGTGADGGKYEIIQTGLYDFMIHANGKHIDTYSSLQRAMSVLKNEVPGLQKDVAEGKTGPGLWANIRAKQKRIKSGSGERMREPGSKGAPSQKNLLAARRGSKD